MPNENVNKVVLGSETLLDLTADTATAEDVAAGKTLHLASGAQATGTACYAGAPENNGNANTANGILFGAVDSTSMATAFTATVEGLDEYRDGTTVMLKNGVVTSTTNFTLNVNGLGAKPVYTNLAAATRDTTIFNAAYTMLFVYDSTRVSGGAWICYRGYDSNTNTIGYQLRTNNTVRNVSDTARYYKIYFTSADNLTWVPASVNSTNNATSARPVNQRPIDPFGPIVYTSANTNYAAGANLAAATIWEQYNLNLGYSFNRTGAALALTAEKPVYVKCAPQAAGGAIMDADEPIVQALPTSKDGKIYLYLGLATSATAVELQVWHPVYWHDGTGIRIWTGAEPASGGIEAITLNTSAEPYSVPVSAYGKATINIGDGLSVDEGDGWVELSADVPNPATASPLMDGTAAVGTSAKYAREDHVHPTDTSRVPTSAKSSDNVFTSSMNNSGNTATLSVESSNVQNLVSARKDEIRLYASGTGDSLVHLYSDGHISFLADSVSLDDGGNVTAPTPTAGDSSAKVATTAFVATAVANKQATLVSGTNIKTVNGESILGSGDLTVGGSVSYTTQAVGIPASAWSGTTATVNATGVTADNDVIVAPAPASMSAWAAAGVYCSAQGAGTLTFTCSTAPTEALTANVMCFEGGGQ